MNSDEVKGCFYGGTCKKKNMLRRSSQYLRKRERCLKVQLWTYVDMCFNDYVIVIVYLVWQMCYAYIDIMGRDWPLDDKITTKVVLR